MSVPTTRLAFVNPDDLLAQLDPEQREVALAVHGPVRVLAGAGTGKTRAITHRIAYGVAAGIYTPTEVLAVTFTTRAAGEMRSRLRALGAPGVQARTFHAAALRQVRYFWPKVYGGEPPQLIDSKLGLVGRSAKSLGLPTDRPKLRDVASKVAHFPTGPGTHHANLWAPELHQLGGKWYLYYTSGAGPDSTQRLWVLKNISPDPTKGRWTEKGKI